MDGIRINRIAHAVAAPDPAVFRRAVRGVEDPGELVALHVRRVETRVRGDGGFTGQDIGIVVAVGDRAAVIFDDPAYRRARNAEAVEHRGRGGIFISNATRATGRRHFTQVFTVRNRPRIPARYPATVGGGDRAAVRAARHRPRIKGNDPSRISTPPLSTPFVKTRSG